IFAVKALAAIKAEGSAPCPIGGRKTRSGRGGPRRTTPARFATKHLPRGLRQARHFVPRLRPPVPSPAPDGYDRTGARAPPAPAVTGRRLSNGSSAVPRRAGDAGPPRP